MFGSMEASDTECELFYSHMGHEKSINENVNQHPRAICEVIFISLENPFARTGGSNNHPQGQP